MLFRPHSQGETTTTERPSPRLYRLFDPVFGRRDLAARSAQQVRPILRAGFEALLEVLEEHGIDLQDRSGAAGRLRFRQLRRLQRDLNAVREQTIEDLDDVLTDEQLETYKEIQEENRQAIRKRLGR